MLCYADALSTLMNIDPVLLVEAAQIDSILFYFLDNSAFSYLTNWLG